MRREDPSPRESGPYIATFLIDNELLKAAMPLFSIGSSFAT